MGKFSNINKKVNHSGYLKNTYIYNKIFLKTVMILNVSNINIFWEGYNNNNNFVINEGQIQLSLFSYKYVLNLVR